MPAIIAAARLPTYDCSHMTKNTCSAFVPADGAAIAGVRPLSRRLAAGTVLFRQGDRTVGIFRLASGRLSLQRVTPNGARVAMHTVRPGELFAEASIFSARYHCDAEVLADSEVLLYPKEELRRRLKESGEALWDFAGDLARHVQGLRTRLELRQTRSAPERVLQALQLRADANHVCRLDGPLKQWAEEIGLTHEALYRTLATLERSGRIERRRGEIVLAPGDGVPGR
jgi:CRP-like cAMP-binding protein